MRLTSAYSTQTEDNHDAQLQRATQVWIVVHPCRLKYVGMAAHMFQVISVTQVACILVLDV